MKQQILMCCSVYILLLVSADGHGQSKDSTLLGVVRGRVKDSSLNFMLTRATIAVYQHSDGELLQYTLPDNFGEFIIKDLPAKTPLRLVITHVGYKDYLKTISIPLNKDIIDLSICYLHQLDSDSTGNVLDEVVVKGIAPMRMNGDTLEFNADAYKMSENSTPEDWIRRLPGMVIWGDGEITFNGKEIKQVLVDGKPFLGTKKTSVATQNIAMAAVSKLQVYQLNDIKNPLDSTMFANITLKEDRKFGYFGKLAAGYGLSPATKQKTDKLFSTDAMLSGFNKKIQMVAAYGANNVNRIATDVDALIKNSSFKGEGTSLEYQSDFNMRGRNEPQMGGARFQYDIFSGTQARKIKRLNGDYFINQNNTVIMDTSHERKFLTADTTLSQNDNTRNYNRVENQRANFRYEHSAEDYKFDVFVSGLRSNVAGVEEMRGSLEKTGEGTINNTTILDERLTMSKSLLAGVTFTKLEVPNFNSGKRRKIPSAITLNYTINTSESKGNSKSMMSYEFPKEMNQNLDISRLHDAGYDNKVIHQFALNYPGLKQLLLGNRRFGGVNIDLSIGYNLKTGRQGDLVRDFDSLTQAYLSNKDLSYERGQIINDIKPGLRFSKSFYSSLTNRYSKYLLMNLNVEGQNYKYVSNSSKAIQNLVYNYKNFIPNGSIEYSNHQYGSQEMKVIVDYNSKAVYPTIDQLTPLVDAKNPLYTPYGNRNLIPEFHREIGFKYTFATRTSKNPWKAEMNGQIGMIKNKIADSTLYDDMGAKSLFLVNLNGAKSLNSRIEVKKALEINKNNTFEFGLYHNYRISNIPNYINSVLNTSIGRNHNAGGNFAYRNKDLLNIVLEQNIGYFEGEQRGLDNNLFKSLNIYTRAIGTLQFPKNFIWSSNITYNRSSAGSVNAVRFSIWNASLSYRFLKGNTGEVRFSALDLLNQNKAVVNEVVGDTQKLVYSNVLRQYFMISVSYYPRQFGKRNNE